MSLHAFLVGTDSAKVRLVIFVIGLALGAFMATGYKNQRIERLRCRYRRHVLRHHRELDRLKSIHADELS